MSSILEQLDAVLQARKQNDPESSYTATLLAGGVEKIGKKILEESLESILAAQAGKRDEVVKEVADLWFHSMVLLCSQGGDSMAVLKELERRFGLSGHDEKKSRMPS